MCFFSCQCCERIFNQESIRENQIIMQKEKMRIITGENVLEQMPHEKEKHYKIFDIRNRLLFVTPTRRGAMSFLREKLCDPTYRHMPIDSLIYGEFIVKTENL